MREAELKFPVPPSFLLPALAADDIGLTLEEGPTYDLRATYFDTEDLRLARGGATLRYRSGEGDKSGWTLKLPVDGHDATVRDETTFEGTQGAVPEAARHLVTAFARNHSLGPVARLRTKRRVWTVRDDEGEVIAELADDEVSILEGRRVVARYRELEVESLSGSLESLRPIADRLRAAGASSAEPIPKAVRALGPRATAPSDIPADGEIRPSDDAGAAVKAAVARGAKRLIANDPLTRMGEVEGLHQMRVAARRLRSDLQTFGPLIHPDWAEALRSELKWIAGALGEVRDLDVLQERLRHAAEELGESFATLFASLAAQHEEARSQLTAALQSDRYKDLLDRLIDGADQPALTEAAAEPCKSVLPGAVETAWKKLAKEARALTPDDPEEAFHEVRIRAKKARYAAEAVTGALGQDGKSAARFAKRVADVQDVLGTHQDAAVGEELFLSFAAAHPEDGPLNLAIGRLIERQRQEAARCRARFFDVWDKLDSKKNLSWMS
jgi:CHAD domain-containing protein